MGKTNTSPLSGTRDFLPLDVLRRTYVIEIVETVYQSYGFEPLETPAMERLETLLGKYGEEGDQLIFRVMKRGEKLARVMEQEISEDMLADSGLRYDLTVPLARVAAEYQAVLPKVFKRYQIQPVYRADRPAKGRFREFFQCDLDIVGTNSPVVEAEVLSAAAEVLHRLGFRQEPDFQIRLNHRTILRELMTIAGVAADQEEDALVAIDKLDRIGLDGVRRELAERGLSSRASETLMGLLGEAPSENALLISWLKERLSASVHGCAAVSRLEQILALCRSGPAGGHLQVDPYLARGLSYYTGPIFEVNFAGYSGSAGGGGRYDNLIGMFSGKSIPACGFSLGLERVLMILEEKSLFPDRLAGQPDALMTLHSEELISASLALARSLRSTGLRIDLFPEPGKYGRQFKYADQRRIRYCLLLGPAEQERGVVAVKDLIRGGQVEVKASELAGWLTGAFCEDSTSGTR